MKLTKHEWIEFWSSIGDDWYHDDSTFHEHEAKDMPDLIEGDSTLCWQCRGAASSIRD